MGMRVATGLLVVFFISASVAAVAHSMGMVTAGELGAWAIAFLLIASGLEVTIWEMEDVGRGASGR